MDQTKLLIVAVAEQCRSAIARSRVEGSGLPTALRPKHLKWMCDVIENHAVDWPATKLHRWIGYVQGGLMANHILDLSGVRVMFEKARNAYGDLVDDQDLVDHLNAGSSFEMDLGGQG